MRPVLSLHAPHHRLLLVVIVLLESTDRAFPRLTQSQDSNRPTDKPARLKQRSRIGPLSSSHPTRKNAAKL